MTWGMVAKAAMDGAKGVVSAQGQNKANFQNAAQGFREEEAQWTQNTGDNKARAEANLQNTIRTGYKVGLLNVQQANAKKALLAQGINLGKSRAQALGAATANAAAAGQIGASVDAIATDIESKIGDAKAQLDADYYQTAQNFEVQLHDLLLSGQDALQSAKRISVRETQMPTYTSETDAILNGMLGVAGQYAQDNMKLGLGDKKWSATDSPGASDTAFDTGSSGLSGSDVMSAF